MSVQLPATNIGGSEVRNLLVDNGSSYDILFLEAFLKMGINQKNLKPYSDGIVGFTCHETSITGLITQPVNIKNGPEYQ